MRDFPVEPIDYHDRSPQAAAIEALLTRVDYKDMTADQLAKCLSALIGLFGSALARNRQEIASGYADQASFIIAEFVRRSRDLDRPHAHEGVNR